MISAETKICLGCKSRLPITEFNKRASSRDGMQTKCRPCHSKVKVIGRDRRKKTVFDYLLSHPCVDCGEKDPIVLDFDHIRDKKYNICTMMTQYHPIDKILEEIEKCVVRCANCHRRTTAAKNNNYKVRFMLSRSTYTGK